MRFFNFSISQMLFFILTSFFKYLFKKKNIYKIDELRGLRNIVSYRNWTYFGFHSTFKRYLLFFFCFTQKSEFQFFAPTPSETELRRLKKNKFYLCQIIAQLCFYIILTIFLLTFYFVFCTTIVWITPKTSAVHCVDTIRRARHRFGV